MKRIFIIWALLIGVCYAQSKAGFYVVGGKVITVQDTSSRNYLKAVENAGVVPSVLQNAASNFLVTSEKAIGSYSLITAQYPFIGGNAATHKFNLNNPVDTDLGFRLVFFNSPTHTSAGVLFNGTTQYANTFLNPSTALSTTSNHISYYTPTNSLTGIQLPMGAATDGAGISFLHLNYSSANFISGSEASLVAYTPVSTNGYTIGTKIANNNQSVFYKGVKLATSTVSSSTLPNLNIYIGARNRSVSPFIDLYSTHTAGYVSAGSGMTDAISLGQSRIVTFFNSMQNR